MMERRDSVSTVIPFAVLMDRNVIMADPAVQKIEITYPLVSSNGKAYSADAWIPYPMDRPFQNVRQVTVDPKPAAIVADRFGNRWAHIRWERVTGNVRALVRFDIITAAAAYTLDRSYTLKAGDIPDDVQARSLGETYSFDLSHYVIKSHSTRIDMNGTWLSRILAVRDYINSTVRYCGYDDRWAKASDYLFKGRGDAYGQTVSFAAVSRYLGVPARAAGGMCMETTKSDREPVCGAAWNQVYTPGPGWIDVGIGRGYGGKDEYFAGRPNRYFVTFEGDFDRIDYQTVFAMTDWRGVFKWKSIDEKNQADVGFGRIRVSAHDLRE